MVVISKPLKLKPNIAHSKSDPQLKKEITKPVETKEGMNMTDAERSFRAVQRQRLLDKIQEGTAPSYRQKVQKYNKLLASYSDHFDIKKTSD